MANQPRFKEGTGKFEGVNITVDGHSFDIGQLRESIDKVIKTIIRLEWSRAHAAHESNAKSERGAWRMGTRLLGEPTVELCFIN